MSMAQETVSKLTRQDNEWIIRRLFDQMWNQRRLEIADELFSPYSRMHVLRYGVPITSVGPGAEKVKPLVAQWLTAFSELCFELEQLTEDRDRVVTKSLLHGTQRGSWLGLEPTDTAVRIPMVMLHYIEAGKITQYWVLIKAPATCR